MRKHLVLATALVLFIAPGCANKAKKVSEKVPADKLVAEVNDWQLSQEQLEDVLHRLPDEQRARYSTPDGMAKLAQRMMQEEMAYREAEKKGFDKREDVAKQLEAARRDILIAKYIEEDVDSKARPSDQELHEYYDSHQDLYTQLERMRGQHIFSKDKAKLEELKTRVEEGGEKFTTLAQTYSEDDVTKKDGGDLGYFNPGGYIKGIGFSQTFSDQVSVMEPGKIYGPIKWEQGYSLVRINERVPAEVMPFESVRDDIAKKMSADKLDAVRDQEFAVIAKNYTTHNLLQEKLDKGQRSPQELFDFAQNSSDPQTRINAFQQIVDKFPQDKVAPQAMFMIGFVYAEEVKDRVMADHTFTTLIEKYPDSEMAKTARWMIDNLDEPMPKFQDLDDLNKQIDKKKGS
ncbi:MAG TPA: peptidyl-prolyl cis-trans isomerase [Candidatus Krumholzibacteria bacterium]|nr:peptidyl-prolyl cis-trans isomerase [Candidatus Krumholzibacteria bacterium]